MSGTGSDLAVRGRHGQLDSGPAAALTLRSDQKRFDDQQRAALATLGIKSDAPQADLDVFLHVSQRMGLDPFAKQIHLIYYRVNEPVYRNGEWKDNWIEKPSIQTGIAGFRVQRDRVAARLGVLVDYEDTLWFNAEGKSFDVWLWDDAPTACRVVTRISDGRRFSATLRFNEFAKRARNGQLTGRWRDAGSYQIEKCAEAASLRKAFPQDFAGIDLDDEIESDPDAPDTLPQQPPARPRVTGAQAAARASQTVTATVETVTPNVPSAPSAPAAASPAPPESESADGTPASPDQLRDINRLLEQLGYAGDDQRDARLRAVALIARRPADQLTAADATKVKDTLDAITDPTDLAAYLDDLATAGDPRDQDEETTNA